MNEQFEEPKENLQKCKRFCMDFGVEHFIPITDSYLGIVSIIDCKMGKGLAELKAGAQHYKKAERKSALAVSEYILGRVYLQMLDGSSPISLWMVIKNLGFIIKNVPVAGKKAEAHFNRAIDLAKETGATSVLAQAYLDLGLLHKLKKKNAQARECLLKAVQIFENNNADVFLKNAKEALSSLG